MKTFTARLLLVVFLALAWTADAADRLTLAWTNNILTVAAPQMPGGKVDIWWLEAFCRKGSTRRDWNLTTIPHKTDLLEVSKGGRRLRLRSRVEPGVVALHELRAGKDEVDFRITLENFSDQPVDLEWFEPCIRVDRFTGRSQSNYIERCFIFTDRGLARLNELPRNEEALYRGGQVFVPTGINLDDVNPRPISPVTPANGLIGCFSYDDRWLLATAWDRTQHLFQGVIVCIHSDPHVGGLQAGETKQVRGKLYLMPNDPGKLLGRYHRDFPATPSRAAR